MNFDSCLWVLTQLSKPGGSSFLVHPVAWLATDLYRVQISEGGGEYLEGVPFLTLSHLLRPIDPFSPPYAWKWPHNIKRFKLDGHDSISDQVLHMQVLHHSVYFTYGHDSISDQKLVCKYHIIQFIWRSFNILLLEMIQ